MRADEKGFLTSIKKNPTDATARGAYADWLDEHGRPYEAALQRGKAGLSEVYFKLRRKSDGLFSEGADQRPLWSTKGKMWRKLNDLKGHMRAYFYNGKYGSETSADDLEVLLVEVRIAIAAALPVTAQMIPDRPNRHTITVTEPIGPSSDEK